MQAQHSHGALSRLPGAGPLVLCYHALSPDWPADLATTRDELAAHLDLLAGRGYRGVRFADAVAAGPRERLVAVTFDDAFVSVLRDGKPVLDALGWPGSVYVVTGSATVRRPVAWAGTERWLGSDWEHELQPLGWEELRGLAAAGWEVGSHTVSHPRLTALPDADLERELVDSRAVVEHELGAPCPTLAYPYGDVDDRVVAAARRSGYGAAGALPSSLARGGALQWPRIGIYNADRGARFRLKVSPALVRLRSSRAWDAVIAARRAAARRGAAAGAGAAAAGPAG